MKSKVFCLLAYSMLVSGCITKEYYSSNQIEVISAKKENHQLVLSYSVPLETLYYSSGCDVEYNSDTSAVVLQFIRQKLNSPFRGKIPSRLVNTGREAFYQLILPGSILRYSIISPLKTIKI